MTQARGNPKSILIKEAVTVNIEAVASGVVSPGFLVERTNAAVDTVQAHSSAAGANAQVLVALEDELQGNGIDVDYASTDRIPHIRHFRAGDQFLATIDDGETITKGDFLESAGNGKLQKYTSGKAIAVALATIDMSDSSTADPSSDRIVVEVV